jgi:hypothetical protein
MSDQTSKPEVEYCPEWVGPALVGGFVLLMVITFIVIFGVTSNRQAAVASTSSPAPAAVVQAPPPQARPEMHSSVGAEVQRTDDNAVSDFGRHEPVPPRNPVPLVPGDKGVISSMTPVGTSLDAVLAYDHAEEIGDEYRIKEILNADLIFFAESGTKVMVIDRCNLFPRCCSVRILSGPRKGEAGWINVEDVKPL